MTAMLLKWLMLFVVLSTLVCAITYALLSAKETQLRQKVQRLEILNIALQQEITERKHAEKHAKHQAAHDPLTDLPNRRMFDTRLQLAISQAVRHNTNCALLYIDVDHFKLINDTKGHQAADEVLRCLAQQLRSAIRTIDMVARVGGDEFAIIMDSPRDASEARKLADRIFDQVLVGARISISIGIGIFPSDARDLESLVKFADKAMYLAKA
jgi:diguanylate cyclase (GGDEF)-like protein